jgi:hypothetical protein
VVIATVACVAGVEARLLTAAIFELRLGLHPITPESGVLGTPACGSKERPSAGL